MLHKIVEQGKTDAKCTTLLKLSCYVCYQDKLYTRHTLDIKRFIAIGYITIGFGMVGAICGLEITMIKLTSVFVQTTRINACFNSSFLDFEHA